jgi:hypothetical protein
VVGLAVREYCQKKVLPQLEELLLQLEKSLPWLKEPLCSQMLRLILLMAGDTESATGEANPAASWYCSWRSCCCVWGS